MEVREVTKDIDIFKSMAISEWGRGEGAWRTCFESDNSYEPE
jgi:hypothetical protein